MLKIENVRLLTGNEVFPRGCVLIDGPVIVYAGDESGCPACPDAEVLGGKGGILMPGFYNAHCHAAMVMMRGIGSDLKLMDWLQKIFAVEDGLNERLVYEGTRLAMLEMISRGVVAFADMYFFMDQVGRAVSESGMRAYLCRGCTDRNGIDWVTGFYKDFHGAADGRVRVAMGLHAEYTTTPEIAAYAIERARKLNAGIHTHISETKEETEGCMTRHGMTPVQYFNKLGMFEGKTLAAHCVHVTDGDIAILAEKKVDVSHNPASNLKLSSGFAPVNKMLKAGVNVALGTDGASSNNCLDMLSDMRLASLLQKGATGDPSALDAKDSIYMATRAGALALGFENAGLLEKGMRADMILLNCDAANMIPCPDIPAAVAYAAQSGNVRMTMVDGRVLYKDGEFLTLDAEKIRFEGARAARELGVE